MFQAQGKNPLTSEEARFILSEVEKKFSELVKIIKSEARMSSVIPETWQLMKSVQSLVGHGQNLSNLNGMVYLELLKLGAKFMFIPQI